MLKCDWRRMFRRLALGNMKNEIMNLRVLSDTWESRSTLTQLWLWLEGGVEWVLRAKSGEDRFYSMKIFLPRAKCKMNSYTLLKGGWLVRAHCCVNTAVINKMEITIFIKNFILDEGRKWRHYLSLQPAVCPLPRKTKKNRFSTIGGLETFLIVTCHYKKFNLWVSPTCSLWSPTRHSKG